MKLAHPNRIPFQGTLTTLGLPSDRAPSGARGHRVILTHAAAEEALDSLLGMAVGFRKEFDGHDVRQKCGVINDAQIVGDKIRISGHIYGRDYPEVCEGMRKPGVEMGMSYEMMDAHVEDMRAEIWVLTKVIFTGAAILLRDKAAYRSTTVELQAAEATERFTGSMTMEGTFRLLD